MGEAQEDKRLLVLSSLTWTVAFELPVRIGPRHFRAKSLDVLMDKIGAWKPVKGDRVQVLTMIPYRLLITMIPYQLIITYYDSVSTDYDFFMNYYLL